MAIKITLENSEIGGSAKFLNHTKAVCKDEDIEIKINHMKIHRELEMLNDTEIYSLMSKISDAVSVMDTASPEYRELVKLVNRNRNAKGSVIAEGIWNHIASFASGTLANIVSAYLMSR